MNRHAGRRPPPDGEAGHAPGPTPPPLALECATRNRRRRTCRRPGRRRNGHPRRPPDGRGQRIVRTAGDCRPGRRANRPARRGGQSDGYDPDRQRCRGCRPLASAGSDHPQCNSAALSNGTSRSAYAGTFARTDRQPPPRCSTRFVRRVRPRRTGHRHRLPRCCRKRATGTATTSSTRAPGLPLEYNHARLRADGELIRLHDGIDIYAREGEPVVAPFSGVVIDPADRWSPWEGDRYGLTVVIISEEPTSIGYAAVLVHLDRAWVVVGQRVMRGQVLGVLGGTGNAESVDPQLHFELRAPFEIDWSSLGEDRPVDAFNPFPSLERADPHR